MHARAHTHTHTHNHNTTHSFDELLIRFPLQSRKATINPVKKEIRIDKTYPAPSSQSSFSLSAVRSGEQKSCSPLATPPSLALLFLSLLFFYPSLRRCPWLCFVPVSLCQVTSLILQAIRVRAGNVYQAGTLHAHTVKHTQIALIPLSGAVPTPPLPPTPNNHQQRLHL